MSFSFLDEPCILCGWYDSDFGCTCSPLKKWYLCRLIFYADKIFPDTFIALFESKNIGLIF